MRCAVCMSEGRPYDSQYVLMKNGFKASGLAGNRKKFQAPKLIKDEMNKTLFASKALKVNRSIKRSSLTIDTESQANKKLNCEIYNVKNVNYDDDDEDTKLMINHDFEDMRKNQ